MHVLQHIAIQINESPSDIVPLEECKQEAHNTVKGIFEDMYSESEGIGGWSDWYVVGGGRWNPNPDSQYKEDDYSMVVSYGENPELFTKTITEAIEARKESFNNYRKSYDENNTDISTELDKYDGATDYSFSLYPLAKMIDMLQGQWDMNSYFYDVTNWSTNPKFMLDNVDDSWYLIPVDFHF